MSTEFAVDNVQPPRLPYGHTLTAASAIRKRTAPSGLVVEAAGATHDTLSNHHPTHPLVQAAFLAWNDHYPLVITPDAIWLTIAQGLARHIELNAEALRPRFVDFAGKKLLEVRRDTFVKGSVENDWPGCFTEFSDQLAGFIGKKRDLIVADFSTTGPIERAASEIVLMDAMRSYFDYRVMTLCGLPCVRIEGTAADWKNIQRRVVALSEFAPAWWVTPLAYVTEKIVKTINGDRDTRFWRRLISGDHDSGKLAITGWINVFFPYIQKRDGQIAPNRVLSESHGYASVTSPQEPHYAPGLDEFPGGLSSVPFTWNYYDSDIPMRFLGGLVGTAQDADQFLRPVCGWAVAEAKE